MNDKTNAPAATSSAPVKDPVVKSEPVKAEAPRKEDLGERPSIVQAPAEASPSQIAADAINAAENARLERENREAEERSKELPQNVVDEMEAGRAALKRHAIARPEAVSDQPAPAKA